MDFPKVYEEYFNERFGMRGDLIRVNNFLNIELFGRSPLPAVVIGREGWLFPDKNATGQYVLDCYRNCTPFSETDLQHWRKTLADRAAWMNKLGVRYFLVLVPEKSTVYAEMVPSYIHRTGLRSRQDQLLEYLERYPLPDGPEIIDLRPALFQAKKEGILYMRTDSHWNELGGFFGYREIMRNLARYYPVKPWSLSDFRVEWNTPYVGDQAKILGMRNYFREIIPLLLPLRPRQARIIRAAQKTSFLKQYRSTETESGELPITVMIHDSFFQRLMVYFSEHCRWAVCIWDKSRKFHSEEILREKPGLVIEEMVERFFLD